MEYWDEAMEPTVPQTINWHAQLSRFPFHCDLPATIAGALMRGCQEALQLAKPRGQQLVHAVQSLFPEEEESQLHQIAGWVLVNATTRFAEGLVLDLDYNTVDRQRQMAIALMMAQEIFQGLTLILTPYRSQGQRQWQSQWGEVAVAGTYHAASQQLSLAVTLPCAGEVTLTGPDRRAITTPECLDFAFPPLPTQMGDRWYLEIALQAGDLPLLFEVLVQPSVEP